MSRDVFLQVYIGTVNAKNAILAGNIHVNGYRFRAMNLFSYEFDSTSESWARFYSWKAAGSPALVKREAPAVVAQPTWYNSLPSFPSLPSLFEVTPDLSGWPVSSWFFSTPAMCDPKNAESDSFSLPAGIFNKADLDRAFCSRKQHGAISVRQLFENAKVFPPSSPSRFVLPSKDSTPAPVVGTVGAPPPSRRHLDTSTPFDLLPVGSKDVFQQVHQRVSATRSNMRIKVSSVVSQVLKFRDSPPHR